MTGLSDSYQRPINYLRVSVTDRCNLRCLYCMPEEGIPLLAHRDILSFDEIRRVAEAAAGLGVSKLRLSGGEPLVRRDIVVLVGMLSGIKGIDDLSMTTNGVLLEEFAADLKGAGLRRVNISLDSLRRERFQSLSRHDALDRVLRGIERARAVGLEPVKINVVVVRGLNDGEVTDFARLSRDKGWHVRFIELMPFGKLTTPEQFVAVSEMQERIKALGELEPVSLDGGGPAKYFRLPGAKGTIGFITPVSEHFCFRCNRLRLTADGKLHPCLLSDFEIDLRPALRHRDGNGEIKETIKKAIASKPEGHRLSDGIVRQGRMMCQMGG